MNSFGHQMAALRGDPTPASPGTETLRRGELQGTAAEVANVDSFVAGRPAGHRRRGCTQAWRHSPMWRVTHEWFLRMTCLVSLALFADVLPPYRIHRLGGEGNGGDGVGPSHPKSVPEEFHQTKHPASMIQTQIPGTVNQPSALHPQIPSIQPECVGSWPEPIYQQENTRSKVS